MSAVRSDRYVEPRFREPYIHACEGTEKPVQCTRDQVATVDQAIRLPVGWPDPDGINALQFLGWSLAALALGQGAPFWFDALRQVTKLRN